MSEKKVCRLCLSNEPTLNIYKSNMFLYNKIEICCGLKLNENDGLPRKICSLCAGTLDLIVNFRFKCVESDKILRQELDSFSNYKNEKALSVIKIEENDSVIEIPVIKLEIKDEQLDESADTVKLSSLISKQRNLKDGGFVDMESCIKKTLIKNNIDRFLSVSNPRKTSEKIKLLKSRKENKSIKKSLFPKLNVKPASKVRSKTQKIEKKSKQNKYSKRKVIVLEKKINDSAEGEDGVKPVDENEKKVVLKYICSFCGMGFEKNKAYYRHFRRHNKPYICDICAKCFSDRGKLIAHLKTHGEKDHPCEVCGKLFKSTYDSHRHVEIVHKRSRAAECRICGKKLATKFGLKMHIKIHTGEKPFECDVCKQKFTFKYTLILHMRTHTGEKPYVCKYCDSKFSVHKTLKEHERLHTGETPYCCPECNKGFFQLSNMKSHFRNNHRDVEFNYKYVKPMLI